jgi:hypothetical protein
MIAEMPPENLAPWREPNNKMKKVINMQIKGRLERAMGEVQENLAVQYVQKLLRQRGQR